jgi:hypothetical protein
MNIFNIVLMTALVKAGVRWVLQILLVTTVSACAASSADVYHGFKFDSRFVDRDVEILDYQYCDSKSCSARAEQDLVEQGIPSYQRGVFAPMPVGDRLYVKWRLISTGEVLEERLDLRHRLPKQMFAHVFYFEIRQRELFIYLVTPEPRPVDWINPVKGYDRKVIEIYPNLKLEKR